MDQQNTVQTQRPDPATDEVSATETVSRSRGIGRAGRIMLVFAFLIPFVWLGVLRVTTMTTGENSQDALYHAMMAKLARGCTRHVTSRGRRCPCGRTISRTRSCCIMPD